MKKLILATVMLSAFSAHAGYKCEGAKGTVLESFDLEITEKTLEAGLDGSLDGVSKLGKNMLEYSFNNGCDNDVTFRVHQTIPESQPETFSMRVDYYGPYDVLTDTEVICIKSL